MKPALRLHIVCGSASVADRVGATSTIGPSIIFILVDDLRWDEVDYPFVKVRTSSVSHARAVAFKRVHHHAALLAKPRELSHWPIRAQKTASPTTRTAASAVTNSSLSIYCTTPVTRPLFSANGHMGLDDIRDQELTIGDVKGQGSYLNRSST